jgi:hypothetical protein
LKHLEGLDRDGSTVSDSAVSGISA